LVEPTPHVMYCHGEEVKIRLSFSHPDVIFAVEVVYAHSEDRTYTLTLEGNPELAEGSPDTGPDKRSTVLLSGVFDEAHMPGVYGVERVLFHTHTGATFRYDGTLPSDRWRTLELYGSMQQVGDLEVEFDPSD
jgi:hypothetical protein